MTYSQVKDEDLKDLFYMEEPAYFEYMFPDIFRANTGAFFPTIIFIIGLLALMPNINQFRTMSTPT